MQRVNFIGLGNMGGRMAKRLAANATSPSEVSTPAPGGVADLSWDC